MRCHFRFVFIWISSSPYSRIWHFWRSEITIHVPAKLHILIAAKMHSWLETDFQSALIVNQSTGWPFPCYWYYRTIIWQIFPEPAFAHQIYQMVQLTKYGIQGNALENPSMLPMLKIGIIVKSRDCGTLLSQFICDIFTKGKLCPRCLSQFNFLIHDLIFMIARNQETLPKHKTPSHQSLFCIILYNKACTRNKKKC